MMHFRRQHTHCLSDGREDSCSVGADRIMGGERISWWEKAVSVYCPRNSPVRRTNNMKRFWPLLLIVGGVLLVVAGFLYQLFYGGAWGYQDPTPELRASAAFHSLIAAGLFWCGVAVFLVGWVAGIRRFWPLFPIIGGCLLALGGVSFAAAFSGRPELVDFVRIAHNAIIVGWLGILVFLFGVVSGVIRLVTRKPTENRGKSQDQSVPSP
jgi:energy-coupling factor transporter transmembrane protein EcfT